MKPIYEYTVVVLGNGGHDKLGKSRAIKQDEPMNGQLQIISSGDFEQSVNGFRQLLSVVRGKYLMFCDKWHIPDREFFSAMNAVWGQCGKHINVIEWNPKVVCRANKCHWAESETGRKDSRKLVEKAEIRDCWDNYRLRLNNTLRFILKFDAEITFADFDGSDLYTGIEKYLFDYVKETMSVAVCNGDEAETVVGEAFSICTRNCQQQGWGAWYSERRERAYLEQYNQLMDFCDLVSGSDRISSELRALLADVDDEMVIDVIGMGNLSLILWILREKYQKCPELIPFGRDAVIRLHEYGIANMSYLAVTIQFLDIKEGKLFLEGNISLPIVFETEYKFVVSHNGEMRTCELEDCDMDLYLGKHCYECRKVFRIELELGGYDELEFYNQLQGRQYRYGKINALRFSPVADVLPSQYCERDGYSVQIQAQKLICRKVSHDEAGAYEQRFLQTLQGLHSEAADRAIALRKRYFAAQKTKQKPIWLFIDRVDKADDNAEVLFRYARKNLDVDSYFVIQEGTVDDRRLKKLGNIVALNSIEHWYLALMADFILSSQANGLMENPFREEAEYYRDLYHLPRFVFLQHGITKDDQHFAFNRFNANLWAIVTSAQREKESFLQYPYFYKDSAIWLTGMPRFDRLYDNKQNVILIMPSWRKSLMSQQWDEPTKSLIWKIHDDFGESEYVQRYRGLLSDTRLRELCEKKGYRFAFMPHAMMEPYLDYFSFDGNVCEFWNQEKPYREAFAEGSILVTDYSSVAFDFAYLRKPVIYYQFDREEFFRSHTYTKGYFDYTGDGFGPVVETLENLIDEIARLLERDCEIEDCYRQRIDEFYAFHDKNSCKRICEKIFEEARK